MGALPKNKITRAERGKRRAGNTPSLKRDHRVVTVPMHKRGLANSIMAAIGLTKDAATTSASKKASKADKKASQAATAAQAQEHAKVSPSKAQTAAPAPAQRTQHKG